MKTENVNYKKCSSKFKCFFALLMAFSLVLQLPGVSSIIMAAEPNKPPVVTSDAEAVAEALSAADTALNPTYYIMGKPTSGFTSIDNIGDKDAPSIKSSPVISAVDEDGTLSAVRELGGNHQENVPAFGLSFEKASDNSKLSILGKYELEPGGLPTRYTEFSDNDGSKVEYRYKILAYTDQLKDDEAIVKSFGKPISNDDIFSKLNLAIKSNKYSDKYVYDSYQDYFRGTFTTKYAMRSVVGYERDLDANHASSTDLASISDNK